MVPPRSSLPIEPATVEADAIEALRAATIEERGRMVARAVRAAVRIDRSRRAAGLPEGVPEPWPRSTREFLRRHAAAWWRRGAGAAGTDEGQ